tara:strand:+ start:1237 stop:1839 length:603 start_codon:yes stop_codon:yes gene_type:complete
MSKGRQRIREKRARKYFSGGTMPDGLELFPLDGGKLEVMQEIMEAASVDDISEDQLGYCMMMLYASKYGSVKDMDIEEIAEAGRQVGITATLEDRQAAEEVIVADFDALQASIATSPKPQARTAVEPDPSASQPSSGQDSASDTPAPNSIQFPPSKSSRSHSPKPTQTETMENPSTGRTQTETNSKAQNKDLSNSGQPIG